MDRSIRTADLLPVLGRAGEKVSNLVFAEAGDWAGGIDDHRHAVGADDVIVHLDAARLGHLFFTVDDDARRGGDITFPGNQPRKSRPGPFAFEIKSKFWMVFLVFGDETRGQFFADGVGAFDDHFVLRRSRRRRCGFLFFRTTGDNNSGQKQPGQADEADSFQTDRLVAESYFHSSSFGHQGNDLRRVLNRHRVEIKEKKLKVSEYWRAVREDGTLPQNG